MSLAPLEVTDVDGTSLVIQSPEPKPFGEQVTNGAVVQIECSIWLATRRQLDELIAKLVQFGNALDAAAGVAS